MKNHTAATSVETTTVANRGDLPERQDEDRHPDRHRAADLRRAPGVDPFGRVAEGRVSRPACERTANSPESCMCAANVPLSIDTYTQVDLAMSPCPERQRVPFLCREALAILGPAGAGKSWLARQLAEILDLPVVHLDRLYWKPDGCRRPIRSGTRSSSASSSATRGSPTASRRAGRARPWLDAADTIVFIDASPLACVWRVTRRRLDQPRARRCPPTASRPRSTGLPEISPLSPGLPEVVRPEVLADLARREPRQQVFVLRSDEDMQRFLADAKAQRARVGNL